LLASLEHPRIMSIYDIVRDRGWLILELMRGSMEQLQDGRPVDLKDLRLIIIWMAKALRFLERNGIVHGDVKPSNILVDKNRHVKLGDFGIARRLSGDDVSLIKGTTKYLSPEVVSDQFGEVGPQSDLYSLGFSAYELMCGKHFETLFPGLDMYGPNRQVAWLMWHSSADLTLPPISQAFEGVPEDLDFLEEMGRKVIKGSLCGLGQTAPNPVLATLRYYRHEYENHVNNKQCEELSCDKLVDVKLDQANCIKCKLCIKNCPVDAVSDDFVIDNNKCTRCNTCIEVCPKDTIFRVKKGEGFYSE